MKYYNIITFGCQMNIADSETLAGELEKREYKATNNLENADIVVINTCAIRDTAEKKILAKIGGLKIWKKTDPKRILAVGGCMTAQKEIPTNLIKTFPFIDIIFGTENLSNFGLLLDEFVKTRRKQIQTAPETKVSRCVEPKRDRQINAWVKIMYGCNNFCSYCIVPYVRGREQSREKLEIINEVKNLIQNGYKQITLLGQNVNSYGNDNPEKYGNFPQLLKEIDKIKGDYRIRFMTSHPKDLTKELIDVIANSEHICHSIHLPFQSGSTAILSAMNRKYTREQYLEKVKLIKSKIHDVELSSDCIVGFPGETEKDFEDTLSLVQQVKFLNMYMFVYSKRKGTAAEKLEQVSDSIKKDRIKKLVGLQNKISAELSKKYVGHDYKVLVEGFDPKENCYVGVTDSGKSVFIKSDKNILGEFKLVHIESCKGSKLYSNIIK